MEKRKILSKNKKGAMQMSVGTIVTIVLLMSVLVLGLILTRNIMCSGIALTNQIDQKMKDEVQNLFSSGQMGVKCLGEGSETAKLGTGGTRKIFCMIKTENQNQDYSLKVESVESINSDRGGASSDVVNNWVLDKGWNGVVNPNEGDKARPVLVMDIPEDAPTTSLKIKIESKIGEKTNTHTSYIEVTPVGDFKRTVC